MSAGLADKLPDSTGKAGIRVWLKSSGYARRLLLGEAGDPWLSAAGYLAFFSQAHGLLRPDVAIIDVGELLASWAGRHADLVTEMGSKRRATFPLRKLLEAEGPRHLLAEVLDAVSGCLRGQAPAVLALPTPRGFLAFANELVGRADTAIEGDDLEDAAMYMADFFRSVSQAPVGGILLDDGAHPTLGSEVERCRPVLNVAAHYRWGVAWRAAGDAEAVGAIAEVADAVITPLPVPLFSKAVGLDIGQVLWAGGPLPALAANQFYFAEIPETQKPESVLDNLARLRG
jgi:hypothetical protein